MYTEIKLDTFDQFTHCLNYPMECILRKTFTETEAKKYEHNIFFRGQEDAKFKLVPSYFRELEFFEEVGGVYRSKITSERIVLQEFNALKDLCQLPNFFISHNINEEIFNEDYFKKHYENALCKWPGEEYYNALELAQHHNNKDGIKTSLLDWTPNSHIAAFFAVQPYVINSDKTGIYRNPYDEFAVWCYCHDEDDLKKYGVHFMKSPDNYDENMTAQKGHFTFVEQDMRNGDFFTVKTLEDVLPKERLFKITAPISIVYSIMKWCDEEKKINSSTVYAAEGVTSQSSYITERKIWHKALGLDFARNPLKGSVVI